MKHHKGMLIFSCVVSLALMTLWVSNGGLSFFLKPSSKEVSVTEKMNKLNTPRLVIDANIGNTPTPQPTMPSISIAGFGGMKIPCGETDVEVALYNPIENTNWYYLTYELTLDETGEVLFSTGLIPPDMYCTKVVLSKAFSEGRYKCTMHVQPYLINDELTLTNNAVFPVELIAE